MMLYAVILFCVQALYVNLSIHQNSPLIVKLIVVYRIQGQSHPSKEYTRILMRTPNKEGLLEETYSTQAGPPKECHVIMASHMACDMCDNGKLVMSYIYWAIL